MIQSEHDISLFLMSLGFYPTRGGAELRFRRYLPGLRQRGISTRVLSGTPEARKIVEADLVEDWYRRPVGDVLPTEMLEGTPIHRIRLPERDQDRRSELLSCELYRLCQEHINRPDVVQLVTTLRSSMKPYLSKIRSLGISLVYAHTSNVQWPSDPFKRFMRRRSFRGLCHQMDCIVTSSVTAEGLLRQLGVKNRIEIIPNGVDLKRFQPPKHEQEVLQLRKSISVPQKAQVVVFIGTINPLKGVDLLLEAWISVAKRFPDAHLYLIGMRHDLNMSRLHDFKEKIESLVTASQAADRIHFMNYIQNVEDFLKVADIMVFPSRTEGMGNAVVEAMACGLASVLTPFIGLPPEFGKPGHEYLLTEHDPGAIATAIGQLLDNGDLRLRIAKNALSRIRQTMGVEQTLDKYAALYRKVASIRRQE